ncbi:hypothetical protein [Methylocella sp.]|uniref:hypothetical protein n=1 Tax=Methylocella sp. TaxID=1978226 RepID=UPI003784C5D0
MSYVDLKTLTLDEIADVIRAWNDAQEQSGGELRDDEARALAEWLDSDESMEVMIGH